MFKFIKSLTEQEAAPAIPVYNGTGNPNTSGQKVASETDVTFKNERAAVNSQDVDAATVTSYLDKAQKVNDGVECVGFAVELDDGQLVKMYVSKDDAEKFEDSLATALGGEEEFEDVLLRFADEFDIVDIIWPDDTYPRVDVPAEAPVEDTQVEPESPNSNAGGDDELKSEITQQEKPEGDSSSEAPAQDPEQTDAQQEPSTDPVDGQQETTDDADYHQTKKEFDELFGDEMSSDEAPKSEKTDDVESDGEPKAQASSDAPQDEQPTPTEDAEDKEKTEDGGDSDTDEDKKSETTDDDVSVVIHPKKKKISESVEPADAAEKSKSNDLFRVMGLDSEYSMVGSKIETLIGKRILAILGFIGIPGSMLMKMDEIDDSINSAADEISANAITRSNFNKIYHQIVTAEKAEKVSDVEYREEFSNFLTVLGIDVSKLQSTRQGVSAILFGAYCISNSPETKVAFTTFMDQVEPTVDEPASEVEPQQKISESIVPTRSHDEFNRMMKNFYSDYREWMPRDKQLQLVESYLSGADVKVYHFDADEGDPDAHIPHLEKIFASSPTDGNGIYEVVCLRKPAKSISH